MNILSTIRSFFGFTQTQMSDYLQVNQALVADFEKGYRPLPKKAIEAIDQISTRLAEFETVDPNEFDTRFPTDRQEELDFWKKVADKAKKKVQGLKEELEWMETSRDQIVRVHRFSEVVFAGAENPIGPRKLWWELQKARLPKKIASVSQSEYKKLIFNIRLLEKEILEAEELVKFWQG
jgi:transcriptional regulator with XRE-family HTH domain